jgi:hypothetical protein
MWEILSLVDVIKEQQVVCLLSERESFGALLS